MLHLQHGPGVLGVGGGVPEIAGEQSSGHGVARSRQQPLPLYIHSMLLVPLRARPAAQRKLMARQSILNKRALPQHRATIIAGVCKSLQQKGLGHQVCIVAMDRVEQMMLHE